jgi:hypothetical protein
VLNMLNSKASAEFQAGEIEEAKETATHAVNYFLSTFSSSNAAKSQHERMMLQCQVQVSALLLRKVGVSYQEMGKEREDEDLVLTGNDLLSRSSLVLKLTQPVGDSKTAVARSSHTTRQYGLKDCANR